MQMHSNVKHSRRRHEAAPFQGRSGARVNCLKLDIDQIPVVAASIQSVLEVEVEPGFFVTLLKIWRGAVASPPFAPLFDCARGVLSSVFSRGVEKPALG
jgi:hypothetical protein